jgi:hypothetical protein
MSSQERAKRSPVPRDPKTWAREVDGIMAFLDRLPAWETVYGLKWCERMGEYYRSRLALLRATPPPTKTRRPRNGNRPTKRTRG